MLRREAIKKAKATAKRIKDLVYVLQDDNCGFRGYFTLTQNQYDQDSNPDLLSMIVVGYDQYGRNC